VLLFGLLAAKRILAGLPRAGGTPDVKGEDTKTL